MAFVGPLDAFNSQPIQTTIPNSTKPIFTATSTKVTKDASGKVTGGTTTVYYSADAGIYVPAATTTDGGKTWTYLKDSNGKEILGASAKNSLERGALKTNTQQQILSATKQRPLGGGLSSEEQKIVALSAQNTATTSTSGEQQGGEATDTDLTTGFETLRSIEIKDSKKTRNVENYPDSQYLTYPYNLNLTKQDSVRFTMLKYAPKKASISGIKKGDPFEKRQDTEKRRGKTVILPIQSGISDSNNVSWNKDDINAAQAIGAVSALSGITEGASGLIESLKSGVDLLKTSNSDIKSAVAAYYAGQAAQVQGLLTRTTGSIINSNTELLFQGPELRTFTFITAMSARDEKEAKNIRNIIRFFKQGMSVKRAETGLFLKTPHTFEIKYYYKNTPDHPWINKIKECALTSCNVNYTPAQTYSTYEDGSMTMYEITLQFAELEPIYDDDYFEVDKNTTDPFKTEIGY